MGCSSFALRAMIPAMLENNRVELICVASRSLDKAGAVADKFMCESVDDYDELLKVRELDAVYIPLPTGLHLEWCTKALEAGKHLLVEKSFAMNQADAETMLDCAKHNNRLVFENFQFQTHSQWKTILHYINSKELGDIHLVRSTFGFPPLPKDNFRWSKELGGGALLDAGAYMAKVSQLLLGLDAEVVGALLHEDALSKVNVYGEAMLRNCEGQVAQVAFGFDYFYQCRLELLGTKGKLTASRVFTAPPGFEPIIIVEKAEGVSEITLPADNHYFNMWSWFVDEVQRGNYAEHWNVIRDQARLIESFRSKASDFTNLLNRREM